MEQVTRPSDVAEQIAAVLDDNVNAPVPVLLQFELALANNPGDATARRVYRDWLLEHGCARRVEQLDQELGMHIPPEYTGPVRPEAVPDWEQPDWAGYWGVDAPDGPSGEWREGFSYAMEVVAFWLDFQQRFEKDRPSRWYSTGPGRSRIGMYKSALLGRLMRGEEIRRRPCPRHKGRMWCYWGADLPAGECACQGTGWLPNDAPREAPPVWRKKTARWRDGAGIEETFTRPAR
jgi:uncharacterized protein (TIGR02996 family)